MLVVGLGPLQSIAVGLASRHLSFSILTRGVSIVR